MKEIKELYKEIMVLREKSNILKEKHTKIMNQHSKKMIEINNLRKKDEKYIWCKTHDKKHNINVISSRKHRTQLIYDECLFPEDHIWILTGEKRWFHHEDAYEGAVEIYSKAKCMICGLITYRHTGFNEKSRLPIDMKELDSFEGVDWKFTESMMIG